MQDYFGSSPCLRKEVLKSKCHKLSQVLFLQTLISKVLSVNSWWFYLVKIVSSDKKKN